MCFKKRIALLFTGRQYVFVAEKAKLSSEHMVQLMQYICIYLFYCTEFGIGTTSSISYHSDIDRVLPNDAKQWSTLQESSVCQRRREKIDFLFYCFSHRK